FRRSRGHARTSPRSQHQERRLIPVPGFLRRTPLGTPKEGTSRIDIRKLPFFRPTISNRARFSAPPLLEARSGLPPKSSAISEANCGADETSIEVDALRRAREWRWRLAPSGPQSNHISRRD